MFDLTLAPYAIRVRLCSVTHAKLAGDRPESRPRFVSVRFQCSTLRWGRWEFLRLALRLPLPPLAHAPCFMPPVNVFFFLLVSCRGLRAGVLLFTDTLVNISHASCECMRVVFVDTINNYVPGVKQRIAWMLIFAGWMHPRHPDPDVLCIS